MKKIKYRIAKYVDECLSIIIHMYILCILYRLQTRSNRTDYIHFNATLIKAFLFTYTCSADHEAVIAIWAFRIPYVGEGNIVRVR